MYLPNRAMHSAKHVQRISATIFGTRIALKRPQCQRYLCTKSSDIETTQLKFVEEYRFNPVRQIDAEIDWDAEMVSSYGDEEHTNGRSVLAPLLDESNVYAEPMLKPTFHLAAYVSKSATLQKLIRLGVDLSSLDRRGRFYANLDFDRDVQPHITFLTQTVGLGIDEIGTFITLNPDILRQNLEDLQTRVNFLLSKKFKPDDITRIVRLNKRWLNHSTKDIDARLGFFQKLFRLSGNEVRCIAIAGPKLVTQKQEQILEASFSMKEECGFMAHEAKAILLKCPAVWMLPRLALMENYDYVNHDMGLDNEQLVRTPFILIGRHFRIRERHGFLKKIGRAQYDANKPLYISPDSLALVSDEVFAEELAKRTLAQFHEYLRTL